MTVYHEKYSLYSWGEKKKKRKRFEIKSRDEEERDVHARQRNGIAISTWTIGRKEHGLHGASLVKIFSIRFDPPFLFFFPHASQHTLFLSILPLLLSYIGKIVFSKKRKEKKKGKRTTEDDDDVIIIHRGTHKTSLKNVHARLYYSRNFVGGGWLGRSAF